MPTNVAKPEMPSFQFTGEGHRIVWIVVAGVIRIAKQRVFFLQIAAGLRPIRTHLESGPELKL
jgi:hypothetical protein